MLIYAYIFQHRSLTTHTAQHSTVQHFQKHLFKAAECVSVAIAFDVAVTQIKNMTQTERTNERNETERMWQAAMSSSSSSLFKCAPKCVCLE